MHCTDCGTRYSDGVCPNCHEEAFILRTQGDYVECVSPEFAALASDQERAARKARKLAEQGQ